jgi:DNA-directed RNA polymerase specialized sigma24 family protein
MESLREKEKADVPLDDVLRQEGQQLAAEETEEKERKEKMLDCLEHCTEKLEPASREVIIRYYFGEERVKIENRRALAAELNISVNALSIRACRIRDKLENCVGKCAEK